MSEETKQNPHANQPNNPTKKPDIPNTRDWHETGTLPNGMRVGKRGALWYILDNNGWAISEGYHEITNNGRVGKVGAKTEKITLRDEP